MPRNKAAKMDDSTEGGNLVVDSGKYTLQTDNGFKISQGEIHYLWYFIQGSIMEPELRRWLRRAWGFCERHAAVYLIVDSAFHHDYLHGASVLYEDLFHHVKIYFNRYSIMPVALRLRLRNRRKCPMCELGYDETSRSFASEEILARGCDRANLVAFAARTSTFWKHNICEMCLGQEGGVHLCRPHFLQKLSHLQIEGMEEQRRYVEYLAGQIRHYSRSFRWEYRDTVTVESEASIISAIAWCSGWQHLLSVLEDKKP